MAAPPGCSAKKAETSYTWSVGKLHVIKVKPCCGWQSRHLPAHPYAAPPQPFSLLLQTCLKNNWIVSIEYLRLCLMIFIKAKKQGQVCKFIIIETHREPDKGYWTTIASTYYKHKSPPTPWFVITLYLNICCFRSKKSLPRLPLNLSDKKNSWPVAGLNSKNLPFFNNNILIHKIHLSAVEIWITQSTNHV